MTRNMIASAEHTALDALECGLDGIRRSPRESGMVELIVRRPKVGDREVLAEGLLNVEEGLAGDSWRFRGALRTPPQAANPDKQLTLMNSRTIALIARERSRWPLAGDQLFVDLDLSVENLPPGTSLAIGTAVIEITKEPHTGCVKFRDRFGHDALVFVSTALARDMHLRGVYARVAAPGKVCVGDLVRKVA